MVITLVELKEIVNKSKYSNFGDDREKEYNQLFENFSNSEKFWQLFIVPMTNRIDKKIENKSSQIKFRTGVDIDLQEIASFHYSVFMNIVYSSNVLESKHLSFFENFYTHLGSVCDSVEELLLRLYILFLKSKNIESPILERLSKNKFIEIAKEWYDEYYSTTYEYYLNKGKKPPPIPLLSRKNLLNEYFTNDKSWKKYCKFSQLIKQYRNAIVHNYQIGSIHDTIGQFFVPKKEKIPKYKKWDEVFKGALNPKQFSYDFINREVQMNNDLNEMKEILQELWVKPINDFNNLFYIEKNDEIIKKYNLVING